MHFEVCSLNYSCLNRYERAEFRNEGYGARAAGAAAARATARAGEGAGAVGAARARAAAGLLLRGALNDPHVTQE